MDFYERAYDKAKRDCSMESAQESAELDQSSACLRMVEIREAAAREKALMESLSNERAKALLGAAVQLQQPGYQSSTTMTCTEFGGTVRCW